MKPVATNAEPPAAGASSIRERLNAVDLSQLDRLVSLRQEQERLQTFRKNALGMKDRVAPAVHARVLADYDRRSAALDQESAPLRAAAQGEYRKVQAMLADVDRKRASALELKEEAEFRHEVGELTDQELSTRLAEPKTILESCDQETSLLKAAVDRFVAALGDDLADDAPSEPAPVPAAPPADAIPEMEGTMIVPASALTGTQKTTAASTATAAGTAVFATKQTRVAPAAAPATAGGSEETRLVEFPANLAEILNGGGEETRIFTPDDIARHMPETQAAQRPVAVLTLEDGGKLQEFALNAPVNTIGRADQNEVQIVKPGISRRHAVVEEISGGWILKDMGSNNGTYVNGERVTERRLTDGDQIEVGPAKLTFRAVGSPLAS